MTSQDEVQLLFDELDLENEVDYGNSLFEFDDSIPNLRLPSTLSRNEIELPKTVSIWSGLALIVGVIIGSGIFASPGPVLEHTGSVGAALLVWMIAGFLALTGGLCYAELGTMIPSSGGEYAYISKAFGPLLAFLFSWTSILAGRPGSIAIITTICSEYFVELILQSTLNSSSRWMVKLFGVIIVTILTCLNIYSTIFSTSIQKVLTAAKVLSLVVIGVMGLIYFNSHHSGSFSKPLFEGTTTDPGNLALALFSALWAYDGWNNLNIITGELQDPEKNLPRAIIGGVLLVTLCYTTTNLAYYAVLKPDIIVSSKAIGLEFGLATLGGVGMITIPIIVILSTLGAANASILTGSRVTFISAQQKHAPAFLGVINEKTNTPANALVLQGMITIIFISLGDFTTLVNIYSLIGWFFYFLAVLGVFVMRFTDPYAPRPFKVWLVVPFVFCIVSLALLSFSISGAMWEATLALLFLLSGIPMYYFGTRLPSSSSAWEILLQKFNFLRVGLSRGVYRRQSDIDDGMELERLRM
jgi:amino acid transporter